MCIEAWSVHNLESVCNDLTDRATAIIDYRNMPQLPTVCLL